MRVLFLQLRDPLLERPEFVRHTRLPVLLGSAESTPAPYPVQLQENESLYTAEPLKVTSSLPVFYMSGITGPCRNHEIAARVLPTSKYTAAPEKLGRTGEDLVGPCRTPSDPVGPFAPDEPSRSFRRVTRCAGRPGSSGLKTPAAVGIGYGLERLAMLRHRIEDIRRVANARVA